MQATLRLLRPALALAAFGLIGRAHAQSGSGGSPFMPPAGVAVSTAPSETLEFAGVNVMSDKTYINVFDKQSKKGRWIPVGGNESGISVLAYDPRREQVVVKSGEIQKTLTLRKSSGGFNGPAPAPVAIMPPAAGFAGAGNMPLVSDATPLPSGSGATITLTDTAQPGTSPAKSEGPPKQMTVARQEEEARMLVSDLLEIGMAQRKAYEEAQKKAAGAATDQPANPPAPAPGS